jgi:hypothetical protein
LWNLGTGRERENSPDNEKLNTGRSVPGTSSCYRNKNFVNNNTSAKKDNHIEDHAKTHAEVSRLELLVIARNHLHVL